MGHDRLPSGGDPLVVLRRAATARRIGIAGFWFHGLVAGALATAVLSVQGGGLQNGELLWIGHGGDDASQKRTIAGKAAS